jgi:hypothetical protein
LLSDFESLRFIDHHLDTEDRTGFVIHLQPVLFHTMFDAGSGNPLEGQVTDIADDFAFK